MQHDSFFPQLPEPTLRRLPWYLAYLEILVQQGVMTVSSTRIAKALNVDSSQISKDLSFIGLRGKTKIGYPVQELRDRLTAFLGYSTEHRAIVLGVGSLGGALIHDAGLSKFGLRIMAGFDTDPKKIGTTLCDVPIYDVADMAEKVKELNAEIGILTVSPDAASLGGELLTKAGVKAIWNFTPFRLVTSPDVVVGNTHIYAQLALIYTRIKALS